MISSFRNLTEPLIETPRERMAPDCIGVNVRLDGAGRTDASGRFVCGGSVTLRERKASKMLHRKIVSNYSISPDRCARQVTNRKVCVTKRRRAVLSTSRKMLQLRGIPAWPDRHTGTRRRPKW